MNKYLAERLEASDKLFEQYRGWVEQSPAITATATDLCLYATGSYGRGEAVPASDVDLFFVTGKTATVSRETQILVFSELITINRTHNMPGFSRDCEYLEIHAYQDLLERIGHRDDDYGNTFTARMLLLLEGRPLTGVEIYGALLEDIIARYFEDFMWHASEFTPRFFLNDVTRFWKTLCLNYEAFRNRDDPAVGRLQNLKLRYARKLTCFSTVVAVLAALRRDGRVTPEIVRDMCSMPPLARLEVAADPVPPQLEKLEESYEYFLRLDEECKREQRLLIDDGRWAEAKERSRQFGAALVELIEAVGGDDALQLVAL